MPYSIKQASLLFLVIPIVALLSVACGLDDEGKDSCTQQSDCSDGFVCSGDVCLAEADVPDGGGAVLDADTIDGADACVAEAVVCEEGQCGNVLNTCGQSTNCGGCAGQDTCGGGGVANTCGCTPETDEELCATAGLLECGSVDTIDSCGNARNPSCGTCAGSEECSVWAEGYCDEVVCSGANWCRALDGSLLGTHSVLGIWGDGAGNTYMSAANPTPLGRLLRHDGDNLSIVAEGPYDVVGLSGTSSGVMVATFNGSVVTPDGSGSFTSVLDGTRDWTDIAAITPNDVWAVGFGGLVGILSHFDGSTWTEIEYNDLYAKFLSVSAAASDSVWALGYDSEGGFQFGNEGPFVASYNGVEWDIDTALPTSAALFGIFAAAPNDVWAVGTQGTVIHYDGVEWTASSTGVSVALHTVTKIGDDVWAAGENGVILKKVGTNWVSQQSGTTRDIWSLWAHGTDDLWAGGVNGLLLHYRP